MSTATLLEPETQPVNTQDIRLEESWKQYLAQEFGKPYMLQLKQFLKEEKQAGKTIYPAGGDIFNAFAATPLDNVKVVILGQDPYHGSGQAHGLSFSVRDGVRPPPSLQNIFKELQDDVGAEKFNTEIPNTGNLTPWTQQGVLLLNSVLTVQQRNAGSHQGKGWEQFTDAVVKVLNNQCENLVFLLWGSYAQKKGAVVDRQKHLVVESAHPSPFAAHRGFFGSKPFSKANDYLEEHGKAPIDWRL